MHMATSPTNAVSKPPVVISSASGNTVVINPCQRLNPVIECIRNVGREFGDIVPDFQVGRTTCILFLSLKYHRLHPEYIHQRVQKLGQSYALRVLLLMCDISEHQEPIRELTKVCLINNMTIVVAWNADEAGHYIATYKQFEHRPPDMIKERVDKDHTSVFRSALTSISKVNKTDVETLRTSVGSFAEIAKATPEQLQQLPGFGQVKVRRVKEAFERPFRHNVTSSLSQATALSVRSSQQSKGKEKAAWTSSATDYTFNQDRSGPGPRQRPPSPVWDIELNSNTDLDPEIGPPPSRQLAFSPPAQAKSPIWDIELDLNASDDEE